MESSSQADKPPERTSYRLANIIGTLIALLTLTVPVFVIAYFSSTNTNVWPTPTNPLVRSRD